MKLHYKPSEIRFFAAHIEWLLENLSDDGVFNRLQILRSGEYPPEPTSYTDTGRVQKTKAKNATFETPVQIASEVITRMEACGQDGYMAVEHFADGVPINEIARKRFMSPDYVEKRIKKVKFYISSGDVRPWDDKKVKDKETGEMKTLPGSTYREWCKVHKFERRWR